MPAISIVMLAAVQTIKIGDGVSPGNTAQRAVSILSGASTISG